MLNKTLIILRGVSGSGKTSLATELVQRFSSTDSELLKDSCYAVAADDYFMNEDGQYKWSAEELHKAHEWCRGMVEDYMDLGVNTIVVHNTCTSETELTPYLNLARDYGYTPIVLVVEKRHENKNIHNVPNEVLDRQARRLKESIKLI